MIDKARLRRRKQMDWQCMTCGFKKEICAYKEYMLSVIYDNKCPKCGDDKIRWEMPKQDDDNDSFFLVE